MMKASHDLWTVILGTTAALCTAAALMGGIGLLSMVTGRAADETRSRS